MAENDAGYFLLVEGGRIDHGHHASKAGYALIETQEFARAVQAALDMIDLEDTLVLVTADHSHVFTMGGYTTRGNPILGLVVMNDENGEPRAAPELAADGQPYTTLAYADGPGAVTTMPRPAPEIGVDALTQSLVPLATRYEDGSIDYDETHGGEDVPLYAIGPGADAVGGVIEQDLIYDIMLTAYGWTD
jgi:alkaline phosphatase